MHTGSLCVLRVALCIHQAPLISNSFEQTMRTCRWLFKRLPGVTSLICDAKCRFLYHWLRNDVLVEDRTESNMEAITWLVTQLPMIAKASASKMDLRIMLAVTSGQSSHNILIHHNLRDLSAANLASRKSSWRLCICMAVMKPACHAQWA